MAELWKDGFDHYGVYDGSSGPGRTNMLAGPWAQVDSSTVTVAFGPAWGARTGIGCIGNHSGSTGARRVLPGVTDPVILAAGYSTDQLPNSNNKGAIVTFNDSTNAVIAYLTVESTGAISLYKGIPGGSSTLLATTQGPIVVPENWHFMEMKLARTAGTFRLDVDNVTVLSLSGLTFTGTGGCAQINIVPGATGAGFNSPQQYIDDLIVRDTTGTRNNDFEGDLRIVALYVNSDYAPAQGWTARPRHKFGAGILDNRASNESSVTCGASTSTDLGNGDFTIEQFVRFAALPTGANKAQIFGKWDETNNRRSYQLYLGGPSLEAGNAVFRISTNGMAGTVSELISWPWLPDLDHWYHVAVSRASGETFLFIDGIQQGLPVADANVYFVGAARGALGGQFDGAEVANASFNGFMDEFRLTVGVARYNADFTPPSAPFPRSIGGDPNFASVQWLSGFDSGINDESGIGRLLTANQGATQLTPDDGSFNFQVIAHSTPQDDTFIEAPLISASSILTQTAQPLTTKTVTVGTKNGSTPAVYTWKTVLASAFDVLIGATLNASLANLVAAINAGPGSGTTYGAGTTANNDVNAIQFPIEQIFVQANVPGVAGDAIATATNEAHGSWTGSTLAGGVDIPGPSEFGFQRLPPTTTIVKSISLIHRDFKSDSGTASVQVSFIGPLGGNLDGVDRNVTVTPTYYEDDFDTDPDTAGDLSPTTIIGGRVRINRTS